MQDVSAEKTTVLLLFLWTQIEFFSIQLQKNSPTFYKLKPKNRTHFLSECFHVATAALILQIKTVEAREGEIVGGKTYIYGQSGKMVRAVCVFSFR